MANSILEFLKTLVGKHLNNSPSPIGRWLNGKLITIELGKATIEYIVREEMTNPLGTMQGGVFATMMDDTLGVAVYSLGKDKLYVAVNFYLDYLEGVNAGETVAVTAHILREGNTMINVGLKLENKEGKLIATGKCNLVSKTIEGLRLPRYEGMEKKYPGLEFQNKS
ncbi:MAG: PaaI family thioesterase [Bacteroidales bacterium]|nr:PaaI family thioesterase [Bacteroidales bacterium]